MQAAAVGGESRAGLAELAGAPWLFQRVISLISSSGLCLWLARRGRRPSQTDLPAAVLHSHCPTAPASVQKSCEAQTGAIVAAPVAIPHCNRKSAQGFLVPARCFSNPSQLPHQHSCEPCVARPTLTRPVITLTMSPSPLALSPVEREKTPQRLRCELALLCAMTSADPMLEICVPNEPPCPGLSPAVSTRQNCLPPPHIAALILALGL